MKFKVGDRVIGVSTNVSGIDIQGKTGQIIVIEGYHLPYGVKFDTATYDMHDLAGRCEDEHGLWVEEEHIKLLDEEQPEVKVEKVVETLAISTKICVGDTVKTNSKRYKYIGADWQGKVIDISEGKAITVSNGKFYTIDVKDLYKQCAEIKSETIYDNTKEKKSEKKRKEGEFRIGDRIRAITNVNGYEVKGKEGIIKSISNGGSFGVEFDENVHGHGCEGCVLRGAKSVKQGHGLWLNSNSMILISEDKDKPKRKRDTNFKVGEWVRVRDWEDMKKERRSSDFQIFGKDTETNFIAPMCKLCGMYVKIKSISGNRIEIDKEVINTKLLDFYWHYSLYMFEKIPKYKEGDRVRVRSLEELKKNFNQDTDGNFYLKKGCTFRKEFQKYCGKVYEVKLADEDDVFIDCTPTESWYFNVLTVEKVK